MSDPYRSISTKQTPQSEPILGRKQIRNDAGGYVFQVDDWARLERFLILGTAGGTYYVGEQQLTRENAELIFGLITQDGGRVVRTIVNVSRAGRAPKNDPALFALAVAASAADERTRSAALTSLPLVARTGTHLFQFLTYVQQFRGWGRGLRWAVSRWYERDDLDYQLIKYRQRDGWTHRDVLRKAHPDPLRGISDEQRRALRWAVTGDLYVAETNPLIQAFEAAQRAKVPEEVIHVLREFPDLPREAIPPEFLLDIEVWEQLLDNGMPMTALLRNLATMTRIGVLRPMDPDTHLVAKQLTDGERLRAARVHPLAILVAMRTYAQGYGVRGTTAWTPVPEIVDALDAAFYASFEHLESTGKRFMLGLDVSSSMGWGQIAGSPLTPREGVAAMAMATAAREQHMMVGFSHELVALNISPRQRLDDVIRTMSNIPMGATDASLPIQYAFRHRIEIDAFVTYTDNETWRGNMHPVQALEAYRQTMGIPAKLVVVGMTATRSTIGDPNDPNTLDVVGFDTATPAVINNFVKD